jgi:hypothetical protein
MNIYVTAGLSALALVVASSPAMAAKPVPSMLPACANSNI